MKTNLHPSPETLRDHLLENLPADQSLEIERHLSDCAECQRQLETIAAGGEYWQTVGRHLAPLSSTGASSKTEDASVDHDEIVHTDAELDQVRQLLGPTDDPTKLGRLGRYEIIGIVGTGATAVVLKATDVPLNRFVAIKLLRPSLAASAESRKRFAREARSAAAIVHENVIEIFGVSDDETLPFLVMPYIAGESLAKRIERTPTMTVESILHIACQVADGLQAAHSKSLMHRDIKPSNILLGPGVERLKLTDFGLARAVDDVGLTKTGVVAGTPEYMSPEQASGKPISFRSDLFSLGGVIYTMCTGRAPFQAESCYAILRKIVDENPEPIRTIKPEIPEWLEQLVSRLMAKKVEDRPQSAASVAMELRKCLSHLQDPTHPLPASLLPSENLRGWGKSMAVVTFVLIVVAVCFSFSRSRPEAPELVEMPDVASSLEEGSEWDDGIQESLLRLDEELQSIHEAMTEDE
ncbi:MAG: protein kinase [Planctomycetota bacterium]